MERGECGVLLCLIWTSGLAAHAGGSLWNCSWTGLFPEPAQSLCGHPADVFSDWLHLWVTAGVYRDCSHQLPFPGSSISTNSRGISILGCWITSLAPPPDTTQQNNSIMSALIQLLLDSIYHKTVWCVYFPNAIILSSQKKKVCDEAQLLIKMCFSLLISQIIKLLYILFRWWADHPHMPLRIVNTVITLNHSLVNEIVNHVFAKWKWKLCFFHPMEFLISQNVTSYLGVHICSTLWASCYLIQWSIYPLHVH